MIKRLFLLIAFLLIPLVAEAAISATLLTADGTDTDADSFDTASISPTSNALLVLLVLARRSGGGTPNAPTVTGNGLTWSELETNTAWSSSSRGSIYTAQGASPSAGAVTMDFGGQTQEGVIWSVTEFTGVDTSSPVVQSDNANGTDDSPIVTLSAFSSSNNYAYGGYTMSNENWIKGTGWTELDETQVDSMNRRSAAQYKQDDNTVEASLGRSTIWAAFGIEIQGPQTARRVILIS